MQSFKQDFFHTSIQHTYGHTLHLVSIIETGASCQVCPLPILLTGNARGAGQTGHTKYKLGHMGQRHSEKLSDKTSEMGIYGDLETFDYANEQFSQTCTSSVEQVE